MADTQTTDAPAEQNYTPAPSGFGALASDIYGPDLARAREQRGAAGAGLVEAIRAKGEATRPLIESAQSGLARPLPEPPKGPVLPPPPSRQLHDFLAPVEGEPPERSVMKLISALSVMGTGIGGLAKGDARAALAGMTGALKGWQEGEKDRADRAFSDWEAATARLLKNYEIEHRTYRDIMEDANLTNEQRLTAVKLAAFQADNPMLAAKAEVGNWDAVIGDLAQAQTHADQFQAASQRVQIAHEDRVRHDAQVAADKRERLAEIERHNRELEDAKRLDREEKSRLAAERTADIRSRADEKRQAEKERMEDIMAQYTPEVLEYLGQQYALTNKPPSIGYGGKTGQIIKGMITKAAVDWAKKNGIDPSSLPGIQAEVAASKAAVTTLDRQQSLIMSFVNNFDSAAKYARELSKKVDRTGMPVVNRYYLKVRGQYAGDADVAAFETQVDILASEAAKIMVGTAQGDANTREEFRKRINAAFTPEQFDSIVKVLEKDTEFRRAGYQQEKDSRVKFLKDVTAPRSTGRKEETQAGTIRIRKKGTTQVYEGPASTPIPEGWEKAP